MSLCTVAAPPRARVPGRASRTLRGAPTLQRFNPNLVCVLRYVLSTFSTFSSLDIARQRHDPPPHFFQKSRRGRFMGSLSEKVSS